MRLLLWLMVHPGVGKEIRMLMRCETRLALVEGLFDLPDGTVLVVGTVEERKELPELKVPGYVIIDGQYTFFSLARFNLLNDYVGQRVTIVLRNKQPTVEGDIIAEA